MTRKGKYKKLKRRKKLRPGYIELHDIGSHHNLSDYELHHIVEFDEFYRLGRFVDELSNVILITKRKHKDTIEDRNRIKRYKLSVDDCQEVITLSDVNGENSLELNLKQNEALVKTDLLQYMLRYNEFLLSKLSKK